jgi:cytochrome P450
MQMPWTRAVFEEAMRLYPPAPSINRAAITDDSWQDEKGETVTIEAGTTSAGHALDPASPHAVVGSPRSFHSLAVPAGKPRDRLTAISICPSASAPRICIGATFALQEAVIALGALLSRVSLRLCCGNQTMAGAEAYHAT